MDKAITFEELLNRDGYLAFTNKGVSMMPLLRQDQDIMLIEKKGSNRCKKMDAVLFRRPGGSGTGAYVMHRILRVNPDGTYWIVGDNCISGETVAEENVLGILTGIVRDGKTIPVTDITYRLYVNTWCRFVHLRFAIIRTGRFLGRCLRKLGLRHSRSC